jgi:hypothetical protein
MKNIYFFLFLALIMFDGIAQTTVIDWQRCVGGSGNDALYDLNMESDGNLNMAPQKNIVLAKGGGFFILGQTNSTDGDAPVNSVNNWVGPISIIRLDNNRNVVWKRTLGGLQPPPGSYSKYDHPISIVETSDSGCIVIGHTESSTGDAVGNHGGEDIIVGKFSKTGSLEWSKMYGGVGSERAAGIVQIADSGFIFTGNTTSDSGQVQGNNGGVDVWLVRINKSGNILWQKCMGTAGYEVARSFLKLEENKLLYVGTGSNCTGLTLTYIDTLGNLLAEKCALGMKLRGVTPINDNGFILTGEYGPSLTSTAIAVKIDSAGNTQWFRALDGAWSETFFDTRQTPDGGYIVGGATNSTDGDLAGLGSYSCGCYLGKYDAWIVKLDSLGQVKWQKLLGGSLLDAVSNVFPDGDSSYVCFGITQSSDGDVIGKHASGGGSTTPTQDWWLFKLNVQNTLPVKLTDFTARKEGTANLLKWQTSQEVNFKEFSVERSLNAKEYTQIGLVKAGGNTYKFTDSRPEKTINYYRLKLIDKEGSYTYSYVRSLNNKSIFTVSVYPNPAKEKLHMQIESDKKMNLQLQVLGQDGKIILSNELRLQQGRSVSSINVSSLPAGHYFVKLTYEGKEQSVQKFEKM